MIADSAGRAIAFSLAPGQAHELPYAVPLLATLPGVPLWVVGDRGYSSHAFRTAGESASAALGYRLKASG